MWGDALRQELAGTGVEISAICPGYISQQGMLADTGVPAPSLAGTSTPDDVAIALVKAIEQNKAEIVINGNLITENFTKLLFAIEQFFPRFGDVVNQRLGVTRLNQMRIQNQTDAENSRQKLDLVKSNSGK
jgi:short-subunit dehydrogenase